MDRGGTSGGSRLGLVVATAATALAVALLITDVFGSSGSEAVMRSTNLHRFVDVVAWVGRERGVNAVIGMAVRETYGAGSALVVPEDVTGLRVGAEDEFMGVEQATLNTRLIAPLVADNIHKQDYDGILTATEVAEIAGMDDLVTYPMGVFALPGQSDGSTEVRLFADASRQNLYLLPVDRLSGLGMTP